MGERHETDLVRLAAAAGEELFPVHRIDKVTSGAVLFAKELRWHGPLTRQFAGRTVGKTYLAITAPGGLPAHGVIDLPLSTGRKSRVRVAAPRASIVADSSLGTWSVPESEVFGHVRTYPSVTTFAAVWQDGRHARSPAAATRSGFTWPGSATRSRATRSSGPWVPPGPCCTRGGWRSTPPGAAARGCGRRPLPGPTSGRR